MPRWSVVACVLAVWGCTASPERQAARYEAAVGQSLRGTVCKSAAQVVASLDSVRPDQGCTHELTGAALATAVYHEHGSVPLMVPDDTWVQRPWRVAPVYDPLAAKIRSWNARAGTADDGPVHEFRARMAAEVDIELAQLELATAKNPGDVDGPVQGVDLFDQVAARLTLSPEDDKKLNQRITARGTHQGADFMTHLRSLVDLIVNRVTANHEHILGLRKEMANVKTPRDIERWVRAREMQRFRECGRWLVAKYGRKVRWGSGDYDVVAFTLLRKPVAFVARSTSVRESERLDGVKWKGETAIEPSIFGAILHDDRGIYDKNIHWNEETYMRTGWVLEPRASPVPRPVAHGMRAWTANYADLDTAAYLYGDPLAEVATADLVKPSEWECREVTLPD